MFSVKGPVFKEANIHWLHTGKPTLFCTEVEKYVLVLCTTDVVYKILRCDFFLGGWGKKGGTTSVFVFECFEYYMGSKG